MNQSILRKLATGHQTLGLEITDTQVKICEIKEKGKKKVRVMNYTSVQLPEGVVVDGRVIGNVQLVEIIKSMLSSRRFHTKYIHFAIPSQIVMMRSLNLPDLPKNKLKKLVHYEMKNNLQVAFEEPFYDFVKLPRIQAPDGGVPEKELNLCFVLVAAAPMNILQEYILLFEKLELILCSIEVKSLSLLRLLEWSHVKTDGTNIVVDVNQMNSEITIIEDGSFKITRNVDVSFKSIVQNANSEKNEWLDIYSSPEHTFTNAAQDLISELERLMNFYSYTLNKGDKPIHSIFLSGDLAEMDKLAELMESRLNPKVIPLSWDNIPVVKKTSDWKLPAYAVPLGLALRGKE